MSQDHIDALFRPFRCKSLSLDNRVVMSPMTRYFSPGGAPSDGVADYYARRARGGAGLIITEGVFLDRKVARNQGSVPSLQEDTLAEWTRIVAAVHAEGGKIAPQLWHVGGKVDYNYPEDELGRDLESPSGLVGPDEPGGSAMSEEDVADAIAAFVRAAGMARRAGFDALEFHGGHGYLFDQFFWSASNRRADAYGGATLKERTRFATEVIRQVRSEVGEDLPLFFRLSQWKIDHYGVQMASSPRELEEWVGPLADAGIDIFDCSQRRFWEPEFEGSDLNLAGWVRKLSGRPTMTVGSVGLATDVFKDFETRGVSSPVPKTIRDVAERLDRGDFDLVAVGRSLLADPEWPAKVKSRAFDSLRGYSIDMMQTLE